MTVWAGVDIGNATTEVVLCDDAHGLQVIAADRMPTRGLKGSAKAIDGAARLVARLARSSGTTVQRAAFAPTAPVDSAVRTNQVAPQATGRLQIIVQTASTPRGDGAGVGRPVSVGELARAADGRPVVACVPDSWGFAAAAAHINAAIADGVAVSAVVVANDEAVLIANRLASTVPVADGVNIAATLAASQVAVEVRDRAASLTCLTDPFWLADAFGLAAYERADARAVADQLIDSGCAVVIATQSDPVRTTAAPEPPVRSGGTDNVYEVDLADIAASAHTRRGCVETGFLVSAVLSTAAEQVCGAGALAQALQIPVTEVDSEARAAAAGARTTPGAGPSDVVIDVGGGTVDVVAAETPVVLPGAGQMLTETVAAALTVSRSAAEYAKRGESVAAINASLIEDEHGRRRFLDETLPGSAVGKLLVQGPSGLLPFTDRLAAAEWRAWRQSAKQHVIGTNVAAGLDRVAAGATGVILLGGGAGDDELVGSVSGLLADDLPVGRANVAGQLGVRYGVAYGLILEATR